MTEINPSAPLNPASIRESIFLSKSKSSGQNKSQCDIADITESIYRAYDIRGKYPSEINESVAEIIAKKLSESLFKKGSVVVAHDTRKSSPALYKAVIKGLKVKKRKIIAVGHSTTPMFYFFVVSRKASGGIMVTASHNPPEWNGLKVAGPKVSPISGLDIKKIMNKK